jgi:hypothetical protein
MRISVRVRDYMPFTANCDLYAAVNEAGINLIALHIMQQRPSLFNYASAGIASRPELACGAVVVTPDVKKYNPTQIFTVVAALPVLGADAPPVSLNFAVQVRAAELDFFPPNLITLPAGLNPPLPVQHFSAKVQICAGIDCPGANFIDTLPFGTPFGALDVTDTTVTPSPRKLNCFCLEAFLVGHLELLIVNGQQMLLGLVDGLEITGIGPETLEANLSCYLQTTISVLLREKFTIPLAKVFLDLSNDIQNSLVNVTFVVPPNPPIPNDPAVEDDQLKVFLDLKVGP